MKVPLRAQEAQQAQQALEAAKALKAYQQVSRFACPPLEYAPD